MYKLKIFSVTLTLGLLLALFNNCSPVKNSDSEALSVPSTASNGMEAVITTVNEFGVVSGWAYNPQDMSEKVAVAFYLGSPVDQGGTYLGAIYANGLGLGGSLGGHYYSFQIPEEYKNGELYQVYGYVGTANADGLMPSSPQSFRAYTMSSAYQTFFTSTMNSQLNGGVQRNGQSCMDCHGTIEMDSFFYAIITPAPIEGGTSTNNLLYRKVSGGAGHNGGNFCSSNPSLCTQIEQWWQAQFP